MKYSEHQNVYMERHDVVITARTCSVAAASFLFGMLSISIETIFSQRIYLYSILGLAGVISIPILVVAIKLKLMSS